MLWCAASLLQVETVFFSRDKKITRVIKYLSPEGLETSCIFFQESSYYQVATSRPTILLVSQSTRHETGKHLVTMIMQG